MANCARVERKCIHSFGTTQGTSFKSRFSYVPVANVPFRIRFPRTALAPLTCICSCVKYVGCFALPSIARICTFQGSHHGGAISEKGLFLFSIHGSHGKSLLVATYTHPCLECKHFTKRRTLTVAELIYYTCCVGSGRCDQWWLVEEIYYYQDHACFSSGKE